MFSCHGLLGGNTSQPPVPVPKGYCAAASAAPAPRQQHGDTDQRGAEAAGRHAGIVARARGVLGGCSSDGR